MLNASYLGSTWYEKGKWISSLVAMFFLIDQIRYIYLYSYFFNFF